LGSGSISVLISPAFTQAAGLTSSQINAIISLLQAFGTDWSIVENVQTVLSGGTPTPAIGNTTLSPLSNPACISLSNNLYVDVTDATTDGEISKLQRFLNGRVTGYFGPATLQLVQNWQASNGVVSSGSPDTNGYGYVGPKTRLAMAQDCNNNSNNQTSTKAPVIPTNPPQQTNQNTPTNQTQTQQNQPFPTTTPQPTSTNPVSTSTPPITPTPIPTPATTSPAITALPIKDNFDLYALGSVVGQGGWKTYTNYGTNFIVQSTTTSEGVGALYNNSIGDAVATKSGSLTTDGVQAVYVRTENRSSWNPYTDGNAQVRVSKGEWGSSEVFSAVSFKSDGNVAFFDGNSYVNFATYNDNEWTLLEIQWRLNDAKARYRLNQGMWTDWYNIRNKSASSFTGFDNVGFDFVGGGGGVYFDNLH